MAVELSGPRTDIGGLASLEPLWLELHGHHRDVAAYADLVRDPAASWARRRDWYARLLAAGAAYLTAADERGRVVGYAMVAVEVTPDDTFEVAGGTCELVTLVVTAELRSGGVGRALLRAAEGFARARGCGVMKVAVMSGNARARSFYMADGFAPGEEVLYRRIDAAP